MSDKPIQLAGLRRCCIETILRYDGPEVVGKTEIPCSFYAPTIPQARLNLKGQWELKVDRD